MNRIVASLAAVAAFSVSAPAFASNAPAPMPSASPSAPVSKTHRYCFAEVRDNRTVRKNVCDSRASWRHQGIDPLRYTGK